MGRRQGGRSDSIPYGYRKFQKLRRATMSEPNEVRRCPSPMKCDSALSCSVSSIAPSLDPIRAKLERRMTSLPALSQPLILHDQRSPSPSTFPALAWPIGTISFLPRIPSLHTLAMTICAPTSCRAINGPRKNPREDQRSASAVAEKGRRGPLLEELLAEPWGSRTGGVPGQRPWRSVSSCPMRR
jgi:hypothetical protein